VMPIEAQSSENRNFTNLFRVGSKGGKVCGRAGPNFAFGTRFQRGSSLNLGISVRIGGFPTARAMFWKASLIESAKRRRGPYPETAGEGFVGQFAFLFAEGIDKFGVTERRLVHSGDPRGERRLWIYFAVEIRLNRKNGWPMAGSVLAGGSQAQGHKRWNSGMD